jgi:molybdopterin converting factor small subunit
MIQVRVLAFGALKDALGPNATEVLLREDSTVSDLVAHLSTNYPHAMLRGIAVSINAEYASATHVLRQGDEVGLLPPVSGGSLCPLEVSCELSAEGEAE